jgi:hypothetical protein
MNPQYSYEGNSINAGVGQSNGDLNRTAIGGLSGYAFTVNQGGEYGKHEIIDADRFELEGEFVIFYKKNNQVALRRLHEIGSISAR